MSAGAGDKTEKATPKKRRDAREKGQVLKSTEVNTAFCSLVMFGLMLLLWPYFTEKMGSIFKGFLTEELLAAPQGTLQIPVVQELLLQAALQMAAILLPLLLCAFVAGIAINLVQVGFLFTTKPLAPKLERISPLKGFARIFSVRTLTELLKSTLKVIVLGYIAYQEYEALLTGFPKMMGMSPLAVLLGVMDTVFRIALKMGLGMAVIAMADFFFQWWKYEKDLRMTKQEIKDEYKLTEGDPQIKQKIRQKQRQMSAMRMMESIPGADVVVTNPTHFAVALQYDAEQGGAPLVVAKGQDHLARKIREIAREHGVELVENKPLAQSLYRMCEVGDEIPAEFYQAVADILVYVYRQKQTMKGGHR